MGDQFPATKNTVVMTAPAILEWLSGEIEDVHAMKETRTASVERAVFAAIAGHLQEMSVRFAEACMRGLDGDTTAARRMDRE